MADEEPPSAWSPLRYPVFRALWIASLVSNIGTWMQNVGGVWLMSSLSPSPFLVALMQTATSLPVFLVGIPGRAPPGIVERGEQLATLLAHQKSPTIDDLRQLPGGDASAADMHHCIHVTHPHHKRGGK